MLVIDAVGPARFVVEHYTVTAKVSETTFHRRA
jgi:hypothetical protein